MTALCESAGFAPHVAFHGSEIATIRGFVAAGLGVAVLPPAREETPGITELPLEEPDAFRTVGLIQATARTPSPVLLDFANLVARRAQDCFPHSHPVTDGPAPAGVGPIRVPVGLVVLVGPPASGKTRFVQALIAQQRIGADAVVSSDEIRAELFGVPPTGADRDAVDARVFEERDRRIVARLAAGRIAVAESTNVTPQARARLLAIARPFNVPVTMLRFTSDLTDLLHQHSERGRPDVTAADVRAYAAIMTRDAGTDQLRSEGAAAVHDVPGRGQGVTPAEAAERFSFR